MCKNDVIYKTGSTPRIATPPDEDRATAKSNTYKKLVKIGCVLPNICSRTDEHTDTQTWSSQYSAPLSGEVTKVFTFYGDWGDLLLLAMYTVYSPLTVV